MNPVDYALLAKRAYTDAPTVGKPDSASRMHVYSTLHGDVHVFRGSDDIDSFIADADCVTTFVPGLGRVHAGFYGAVKAILAACLALGPPKAIGGHSLGADMAILYAGILAFMGTVVPVYAFEPARLCGDDVLAQLLKAKQMPWFATRNGRDLVTQIPSDLTLPGPLTMIGTPVWPFDNIEDHDIDQVITALSPSKVST